MLTDFIKVFTFRPFCKSSDLTANPIEIINILTAFTEMFWSFAICAIYCECGEKVTQHFNLFDDEIYRCEWYLLPIKLQKLHLIFMLNTQQPTIIRGYPQIFCTREIFKAVKIHFCNKNSTLNVELIYCR